MPNCQDQVFTVETTFKQIPKLTYLALDIYTQCQLAKLFHGSKSPNNDQSVLLWASYDI